MNMRIPRAGALPALVALLAAIPVQAQEMPAGEMADHAHMHHDAISSAEQASQQAHQQAEQQAAPPPAPSDHAADAIWGAEAMAPSRAALRHEHGGMTTNQIMVDLAEVQFRRGRESYRWEGEGWWGGDIDRLVVKTQGEGRFGGAADDAEAQALYSRAIGPYYNLQAGVRQDIGAGPKRTYAVIGLEGLAPYWFETDAAVFLSDKGDVTARLEGWYDQRITQRLILQPRAEVNLAAQNVPDQAVGAGISNIEAGLRLRYEIAREFAPYVGVSWERKLGRTKRYAQALGEGSGGAAFVIGVRTWF